MKHFILPAMALALTLGLASCSDDTDEKNGAKVGDTISFGISALDTRTHYGTDGEEQWKIFWDFATDKVRIFSRDAYSGSAAPTDRSTSSCAYSLTENSEKTNHAWLVPVTDGSQLKWGEGSGEKHENVFYAAYPSDNTNIKLVSHESSKDSYAVFALPLNTKQDVTVSSGYNENATLTPNLSNQYMLARTKASLTTSTITFHFLPLMTALECSVKRTGQDSQQAATRTLTVDKIIVSSEVPTACLDDAGTSFYYKVATQKTQSSVTTYPDNGICQSDGTLVTSSSDNKTIETALNIASPISLYSQKTLTFTVFLPPYAIAAGKAKITVSGTTADGKSFSNTSTINTAIAASAKKKVALPAITQ